MNPSLALLLALLPALTVASISNVGDCLPGGVNNGRKGGTAENFAKIKDLGELALVGRDPTNAEKGFSCVVVRFNADQTYELRYKDADGVAQTVNGTYTDERDTVPIVNTQNAYSKLEGLPSGVLNGGSLFPITVIGDEVLFQTCRFGIPTSERSTYMTVPLDRAIERGAANDGCGCDDWRSA